MRHFLRAESCLLAFFIDYFLDCPPGSFQLKLPEFPLLGLFEYRTNKITAPQYSLVPLFLFPRSASGYDLGPSAEAAEKSAAGQLRQAPEPDTFPHEPPVLCQALSSCASKLQKNMIRVHPGMLGLPDDRPVAAKGIAVEFFDGLYDVRTQGVKVYVADQGKEVVVFVAKNGFVAVLE